MQQMGLIQLIFELLEDGGVQPMIAAALGVDRNHPSLQLIKIKLHGSTSNAYKM